MCRKIWCLLINWNAWLKGNKCTSLRTFPKWWSITLLRFLFGFFSPREMLNYLTVIWSWQAMDTFLSAFLPLASFLEHCSFPIWKWSGKCCPLNFSCCVKLGQTLQHAIARSDAACYKQSLLNVCAFYCQLYIIWEWTDFPLINLHWIHSSPEKMNSGNYWVLQCCKSFVLFDCSVEKSIAVNSFSFLEGWGLCRALTHLIK